MEQGKNRNIWTGNSSKHTTTEKNQPQSTGQHTELPDAEAPQGEVQSVHLEGSGKGYGEVGGAADGRGRGRSGAARAHLRAGRGEAADAD